MKLITKLRNKFLWNKITKIHKKEMNDYTFSKLWREHDEIKSELRKLSQDQFAKAHLSECQRLEDRITTAFKQWDELIEGMHNRIKKLEDKINT
jgi:hypothetical protein